MAGKKTKTIEIDTSKLSDHHVQLLRNINYLLSHVMSTDEEDEYFEASSELLRVVATAIKRSKFSESSKSEIAYGQQALEFSVDTLQDHIYEGTLVKYEN